MLSSSPSLSFSFSLAAAVVEFRFLGFSFTIMRHSREQRDPFVVQPMVVGCSLQTYETNLISFCKAAYRGLALTDIETNMLSLLSKWNIRLRRSSSGRDVMYLKEARIPKGE